MTTIEINKMMVSRNILTSTEIKSNKRHISLWMVTYLFFLIYDPPIIHQISFIRLLSGFSLIYILLNYKTAKQVMTISNIYKYIAIYLVFCFYVVLCQAFNVFYAGNARLYGNYVHMAIASFTTFGYLFISTSYIVIRCHKNRYNTEDLLIMLVYVGLAQAVLTILAFISPDIKSIFVGLMSKNIDNSNVISRIVLRTSITRVYGFATNLYDMFGYSSSILITISFLQSLVKSKYFIATLILIIMPVLNTRTGILLTVLGAFVVLLNYSIMNRKNLKSVKIILMIILLGSGFAFLMSKVALMYPATYEWIQEGMKSTVNLIKSNEKTGTYKYLLTDRFWFFPTGFRLIFGTGLLPYDIIGKGSDVGYVEMVWRFGIVGSIYIFGFFIKLFRDTYCASDSHATKIIVIFLFISFFVYQIKLNAIGVNQASIVIFAICFMIMYDHNSKSFNDYNRNQ